MPLLKTADVTVVPRLNRMAEIDGFGNRRLHVHSGIPEVRVVRSRSAVAARSGFSAKQYRRGARPTFDRRVQAVSGVCTRFAARSRNSDTYRGLPGISSTGGERAIAPTFS